MKYDPVKYKLGKIVNSSLWLRKLFYRLIDILLLRTWHVKKALRRFAALKKNPVRILDAGSGFGQYTWRMWRINNKWQIDGVDIKQEQVNDCSSFFNRTRAKAKVAFSYADLTEFIRPETYDLILSVDVMEHIENDQAVFSNFYKSMKEQGWLIISTPSDLGGSDVDHHHEDSFVDEHVRDGYSKTEITDKLVKAGFSNISTSYTYGKAGKISWLLTMKYPIILLNTSWLFALLLPFWYILVMPFALLLNVRDLKKDNTEGTGLLVTAIK